MDGLIDCFDVTLLCRSRYHTSIVVFCPTSQRPPWSLSDLHIPQRLFNCPGAFSAVPSFLLNRQTATRSRQGTRRHSIVTRIDTCTHTYARIRRELRASLLANLPACQPACLPSLSEQPACLLAYLSQMRHHPRCVYSLQAGRQAFRLL